MHARISPSETLAIGTARVSERVVRCVECPAAVGCRPRAAALCGTMRPMRTCLIAVVVALLLAPPCPAQTAGNAQLERYEAGLALNPDSAFYQYAVVQTSKRLGL